MTAATCTSACASTRWARSSTAWRCRTCAPTGATFLVFSDYMRAPIRLAAIMELGAIFVSHARLDRPWARMVRPHQPIEHLATLRAIPGLDTIRPGDANEVAEAWRCAAESADHPTALIFSRQALPTLDRSKYAAASGLKKGGYVLADCEGTPDVILIATGRNCRW
ncbi:Transketolase [Sphingomonas paucimobilis]|nr:Transketolase [Sphingomonas paucimobilis]